MGYGAHCGYHQPDNYADSSEYDSEFVFFGR